MTLQELVAERNITNVFHYAAMEEQSFNYNAAEVGYERKTTFYSDLSIGEWHGENGIKDTFNRVCKEWKTNAEYFTEFVMCLNWKSWSWYERQNIELSKLYTDLYNKAYELGVEMLKGEDLSYFFNTLD